MKVYSLLRVAAESFHSRSEAYRRVNAQLLMSCSGVDTESRQSLAVEFLHSVSAFAPKQLRRCFRSSTPSSTPTFDARSGDFCTNRVPSFTLLDAADISVQLGYSHQCNTTDRFP